jgi:PAS domain S-box-containing protein
MSGLERRAGSQKVAEAEVERFHDQLGPFVTAAEDTRMPMVFTNAREPDNPIGFVNDSFLALTGYKRDEVLGQSFNFMMAQGADQDALAKIEAEFRSRIDGQIEIEHRRKDGSTLWVSLFVSSVRDADGQVIQHFASFHDLTRHRDAQVRSRMLIDELNHRVKNTLATVQGIVSQGLRKNPDVATPRPPSRRGSWRCRGRTTSSRMRAGRARACGAWSSTRLSHSASPTAARSASPSRARTSGCRPGPSWRSAWPCTSRPPTPSSTAPCRTMRVAS